MNVFRLNFSHGTHEEHSAVLADIRRTEPGGGPARRRPAGPVRAEDAARADPRRPGRVPAGRGVHPRDRTLFGQRPRADLLVPRAAERPQARRDGAVRRRHRGHDRDRRRAWPGALKVTLPGRLRSRQGLNLPGSELAVKSLTEKDLHDLDWTAATPPTCSSSDCRSSAARRTCLAAAGAAGAEVPGGVVVKIEKPQAVRHLEAIVAATDGVMVARGDLGVEMDVQRVPAIQKRMIELCNAGPPARHHRDADAQQHGALEPADAGRGERRVQRRPRRDRRGDAVGRNGGRRVPGRGGRPRCGRSAPRRRRT